MHSRTQVSDQKHISKVMRTPYCSRPHDMQNFYVSLKQWRIFHAVVDCGGFAEAAKSLHLSQSTISYTVSKLQEQLGTPLLKIEGRKAILTPEGKVLHDRSRQVLKDALELENFARNLGEGCSGEVRLVVDHHFPMQVLMRALGQFAQEGRGAAEVHLYEAASAQVEDMLHGFNVDLAISERVPLGFLGEPLVEVEHLPVAHPEHPLLQLGRTITAADLVRHTQIGLGPVDERERPAGRMRQGLRWSLGSIDTVLDAVGKRLGYAWLPVHRIRTCLGNGTLIPLPLGDARPYKSMLYLVHGRPWTTTPSASRLAEMLRGAAAAA